MYNPRKRHSSTTDEKSEKELANDALVEMKVLESDKRHLMYTIELSNGAIISSTNKERLEEYEIKYARIGVKVKKRYGM
jgi:hypothetical protein